MTQEQLETAVDLKIEALEALEADLQFAYRYKSFNPELVHKIVYHFSAFNEQMGSSPTMFIEWINDIMNETLTIQSSGSFYTALHDDDYLYQEQENNEDLIIDHLV